MMILLLMRSTSLSVCLGQILAEVGIACGCSELSRQCRMVVGTQGR